MPRSSSNARTSSVGRVNPNTHASMLPLFLELNSSGRGRLTLTTMWTRTLPNPSVSPARRSAGS